jgi:hypothetical protein
VCLICKESVVVMKEYNMIKTLLSKTFSVWKFWRPVKKS